MENKLLKKYLLLLGVALTGIAVMSFRLRHEFAKPVPLLITTIETKNKSENRKPNVNKNQKMLLLVARVIDGDTIVVPMNGEQTHVRLIGINSPELNDKRPQVACFAKKAKEEAEKLLDGKNVYLEKGSTQGDYDKYGRLLAYIFLEDGTFFNKLMIENGYAYEYTYRLPYKYQTEFKNAEKNARKLQKGLWNRNICT